MSLSDNLLHKHLDSSFAAHGQNKWCGLAAFFSHAAAIDSAEGVDLRQRST